MWPRRCFVCLSDLARHRYLKRGMETKMLERIIGNLEHSDEEKERRAGLSRN